MFAEVEDDVSDDEKTRRKKRTKKPNVSATTRSPGAERDGLSSGDESSERSDSVCVYVCLQMRLIFMYLRGLAECRVSKHKT